jgi:hypothetical protein
MSVGVKALSEPPKAPKGVLLAATTNTDFESAFATAMMTMEAMKN